RVGDQLPHDRTVPQGAQRHDIGIEPGGFGHGAEVIAMVAAAAVSPPLAVAAQEQRCLARSSGGLLLERQGKRRRDRHRTALLAEGGMRRRGSGPSAGRSATWRRDNGLSLAPVTAATSTITPSARS